MNRAFRKLIMRSKLPAVLVAGISLFAVVNNGVGVGLVEVYDRAP
jgi:hypothetical protein